MNVVAVLDQHRDDESRQGIFDESSPRLEVLRAAGVRTKELPLFFSRNRSCAHLSQSGFRGQRVTMLRQVVEVDLLDAASREAPAGFAADVLRRQRLDVVVAIRTNIHSATRAGFVGSLGIAHRKRRSFNHNLRYLRRGRIHETVDWQTLKKKRLGIVPVATLSLYYPIADRPEKLRQFKCLHNSSSA